MKEMPSRLQRTGFVVAISALLAVSTGGGLLYARQMRETTVNAAATAAARQELLLARASIESASRSLTAAYARLKELEHASKQTAVRCD